MIDFDAVQRLNVQDGDLLVVPEHSDQQDMVQLRDALRIQNPQRKVSIIRGPIQHMDVGDMTQLGWSRA